MRHYPNHRDTGIVFNEKNRYYVEMRYAATFLIQAAEAVKYANPATAAANWTQDRRTAGEFIENAIRIRKEQGNQVAGYDEIEKRLKIAWNHLGKTFETTNAEKAAICGKWAQKAITAAAHAR